MNTLSRITGIFYSPEEKHEIKNRLFTYIKNDSSGKVINIPQEREFLNNTLLKKYVEDHYKKLCLNERSMHQIEINKCLIQYRMNGLMPDMKKAHEYDELYINSIKKTDEGKKINDEIINIPDKDIIDILAIYHGNYNNDNNPIMGTPEE